MLDYVYHESFDWPRMFLPGRIGELDGRTAGIAACLARDSYYNDPRHGDTMLMLGFSDVQLFYNNHLQALAGCRNFMTGDGTATLITIAFRGSDQIQDWLQNLDVRMTRFLNTEHFPHLNRLKVHNGIFEKVHDFEGKTDRIFFRNDLIKSNLAEIINDASRQARCFFWMIGHSLGGAMATLFAARLHDYYGIPFNRILVHTFGAPPIGNRFFAARYGHQSAWRIKKHRKKRDALALFRFVNTEDPIPAPRFADEDTARAEGGVITPPPYRLLGFKHVGQEIRFSPRRLPDFYKTYQTFTGRRYNRSQFMKVHFMEAYMTGLDIMNRM